MKNKTAIIIALCLILLTSVLLTGSANKTNSYVLYKNDTKFDFAEYPAINIDGEIHVPSSFFIGFKNILYEYSDKYQSFYFMNTETGRYFAFSFNASNIILDGEFTQKSFPIRNSTIYMPLEYCADILSLDIETYRENNVQRIRLHDGNVSLEFIELIELFDPAGRLDPPEPPPVDDPITDNPINPETPVVTPSEKTTVYLMIKLVDKDYVECAVDLLFAFGERATLFFDKETLLKFPEEVIHATVGGNSIGIFGEDVASLDDTNTVLEYIINYSTRLCTTSDTSAESQGYTVRTPNVNCSGYSDLNSWEAAEKIYEDAMKHETPYIMIDAVKSNENLLMTLLGMFSNDNFVELETIHPSLP